VITIILILLFLYVVLGVSRIISDFNQPSINQPHYVRNPSITGMLLAFLLAPFFWWTEVTDPTPKEIKMRNKELKKLEKQNKRMMRNIFRK
jgi:hypothetical protein